METDAADQKGSETLNKFLSGVSSECGVVIRRVYECSRYCRTPTYPLQTSPLTFNTPTLYTRGESHVGRDPAHVEVAGHHHLFPLGLHLGRFLLVVHRQPRLPVVAPHEDSVPAQVVDPRLRAHGGRLGAVDGEAQVEPPVGDQELQEVAVPPVVQVEHQGFADVGVQDEAELTRGFGVPLAVARPLTRDALPGGPAAPLHKDSTRPAPCSTLDGAQLRGISPTSCCLVWLS
ncbi:hypothetical protein EYF80_013502 [Liparis tanakae]|uniref:Uncharacterized protein n=1 Tax=Liparis tanakae TaxID=230148 RepID=A0A4Z2IFM4_9TELE|nr:hypothetical protein EYF80_013502 [Liparis tanakae]